ncbi:hypothetical protein ANCDUO_22309, partial [Ancylostoma duodenale]
DNVGQYQCFATNPYGEAQQNIMVDLAIRPNFIQPLFNKTFSDAQPMRLDVRVEGQPFPELKSGDRSSSRRASNSYKRARTCAR